jgi:hypothetical protein
MLSWSADQQLLISACIDATHLWISRRVMRAYGSNEFRPHDSDNPECGAEIKQISHQISHSSFLGWRGCRKSSAGEFAMVKDITENAHPRVTEKGQ